MQLYPLYFFRTKLQNIKTTHNITPNKKKNLKDNTSQSIHIIVEIYK